VVRQILTEMRKIQQENIQVMVRVNFSNVLCAPFKCKDPKSTKIQSSHQCLFALLGSAGVKAACKMLVKLTPAVTAIIWKIRIAAQMRRPRVLGTIL